MKKPCRILCLLIFIIVNSSCSFNKFAVNTSSSLLYNASNELQSEPNYEVFRSGSTANLMLMEGLLSESPQNLDILAILTKGHAGYAFAVNETDMLNEEWGELKTDIGKSQALFGYTRALNFGLRYLKIHKIDLNQLIALINEPQGISHLLDSQLSSSAKDLELVLFTAQSLAALINLQKDNISLVAQLPLAKGLFDWVCTKDPKIVFGACDIFYGSFEASRPKMLGGNPEKGKEIFLRAIKKFPDNWLIRTSYIQYYLIPQDDKAGLDAELAFLKKRQSEYYAFHVYSSGPSGSAAFDWSQEPHLRFYQALALKRYELINKYQKQFF
jgi:TRAP transporter T-component